MAGFSSAGTLSAGAHLSVMCSVAALSSAACEWFLLLLLFIHGLLSYFLREFARYCKLPIPCFLCSRLDHYFSNTVPDSYQSMFCKNHGLEIFSHVVCDDCLLSCAAKRKSITGSPRLQMAKESVCQLNKSINSCNEQSSFGLFSRRVCSCCGKVWSSRKIQQGAIRYRSPVRGLSKPNIPLPNEPSQKVLSFRSNMRRKREKSYGSLYANHLLDALMDRQGNSGYKAVKVTSDFESDSPFSDYGNGKIMVMEAKIVTEGNEIQKTSQSLADAQSNILAHLKSGSKIYTPTNLGADEEVTELNMSGGVQNSSAPAFPEFISLDDNTFKSNRLKYDLPCETTGKDAAETSLTLTSTPVIKPCIFSIADADPGPSTKDVEMLVKESPDKSSMNGENHGFVQHLDILGAVFTCVEDKVDDDTSLVANEHEAPSLSDSNKSLETSTLIGKDKGMKYHNGVEDESQLSSTVQEYVPGTDLQSKGTNSRSQGDNENSKFDITYDSGECMTPRKTDLQSKSTNSRSLGDKENSNFDVACGSRSGECMTPLGTSLQQKGTDLRSQADIENSNFDITCGSIECMTPREADSSERNESAFESTAGSVVSDREGESLVDWLNRQIEYDKKRIASLYKELDEERSASAIAANEAMAMITRLQEEKAALNMEALHYLRMMEEQAEYDVEALEKANDLLSEKEKEIQDLEAVLERSRSKVSDGLIEVHNSEMICNSMDAFSTAIKDQKELRYQQKSKYSNVPDLEEEKAYISECLKRLEQTLLKFPGFGSVSLMSDSVNSELMEDGEPAGSLPSDHHEDNGFCNQNELHVPNGNSIIEVKKLKIQKSEDTDKHGGSEELKTNQDCCKLSLEPHQKAYEGLLIIKEIAHQLQELRKLVLKEHYVVS